MRPLVERDDPCAVVEFLKDDDVAGRLQNLERALVEHAWNAAEETAGVWIDVLPFGDVRVVLEHVVASGSGPRLIRDLPVRRIDDQTGLVGRISAQKHMRRVGSTLDVVGGEAMRLVGPESLNVRLSVGRSALARN